MKPSNIAELAWATLLSAFSAWVLLTRERPAPGTSRFVVFAVLPVVYLVASSGMVLEVLGSERGTAWLVELGRAMKIAAFALVPALVPIAATLPR